MKEELFIDGKYIPLSKSINPSLTKSITDVEEPDKRKATFSKTTSIPNSKEAQDVFGKIFDLNLVDSTFNPTAKADCLYLVNGQPILNGYCQLKAIVQKNDKDLEYNIVMFGSIANIFREMGEKFLNHPDMVDNLDEWDHPFAREIQQFSWATQVYNSDSAGFVPFALGTGYVYPLMDYGFSTDLNNFTFQQMPCALYAKEYIDAIFESNGFTYTSSFFDSTYFKSLIIPSSPASYQLSDADIANLQFSANAPVLTSTGTTTSNTIFPGPAFTPVDTIIFQTEVSDPSGVYDNATGVYTIPSPAFAGIYDINGIVDVTATFTPNTAVPVVCTSDIQGAVYVYVNGVQVLGKPFYITFDDYPGPPYTVGARSTSATPPYPSTDYLDGGTSVRYSQTANAVNANLVPRPVNPPDRIFVSLNNIMLSAGDTIEIKWKARYNGLNGNVNNCFEDILGSGYFGTATIDIAVGAFSNIAQNQYLSELTTLEIERIIPKDIKQKDLFTSIIKMFNLWVDVDPNNDKNLLVEPREDFLGTDVVNIEEKLAHDRDLNIIPMGKLDASDYLFTYKQDKDHYNQKYESQWQEVYGERRIESTNDFVTSQKKTELIFSPTPIVAPPNNDRPIPTIIAVDDLQQPKETDHNIRILYYGGLKPSLNIWNHINFLTGWPWNEVPDPQTTYPYAGHWDDPYNATEDINFGLVKEIYYDNNINPITVTNNNLYNKYYSEMITQYTDKESKIVEGWFNVRPSDFTRWTFDKLYWFENAYFRLQKIENYNPTGNELTKCTFLYLTEAPDFAPTNIPIGGGSGTIPVGSVTKGAVDDSESIPVKATKTAYNPDNNNTTGKGVSIDGKNNAVANDAYYININGDGNKVYHDAKNIEIQGDNNTIDAGVQNVTLINTNGVTVEESNITYINGVLILPLEDQWQDKSVNFTPEDGVIGYRIDASVANIVVDLSAATELSDWIFKALDNGANTIEFSSSSAFTIDGEFTQILNSWESFRIKWNTTTNEYNIIN